MTQNLEVEVGVKSHLTDEQLYLAFITADEGSLYSPEGRIIEGKKRFLSMLAKYKAAVCDAYRNYGSDMPQAVTVAVGIATALSPTLATSGLPLVPFSVLAVRHGLRRLCDDKEEDDD
ncbi:MAG: hypothetical protein ACJ746_27100 [Bryobacteraceae bacterium]